MTGPGEVGVGVEFTEEGTEITQAGDRRGESRQHEHQMIGQRLLQLGGDTVIDPPEFEATNLRAQQPGQRFDPKFTHGSSVGLLASSTICPAYWGQVNGVFCR